MANRNEATGSGSAKELKQEMEEMVWQLNTDKEEYKKSLEDMMEAILGNEVAEFVIARSVEEERTRLAQDLDQLSEWVKEHSAEIDRGTKLRRVGAIKVAIEQLIRIFTVKLEKYKAEKVSKREFTKEQMRKISIELRDARIKLQETAAQLAAIKDKIQDSS